ncbi:MAG: hypothetical protein ABI560_07015 [Myxococcales bacterium]
MPVRTSVVVAGGLLLLGVLGITTIFGESLLAWIAPPAPEGLSAGVTGGLNPAGSSSKASPGALPSVAGPAGTKNGDKNGDKSGEEAAGPPSPAAVPRDPSTSGAGGAADNTERNP